MRPGVETDMGEAIPTWLERPSIIAQRVLERMDAMIAESDDGECPVACNHVAGAIVAGNEDVAHHVISEVAGRAAANLLAVARALEAKPIPAPPSE